jgi:biotin operon repressor
MADQRKRDDYTKDRFDWLDQVAADRDLAASAFKVAYVIATSLWRNKGTVTLVSVSTGPTDDVREAWIGTREIADKIAMSRFTVMTQVRRLEELGHLEVDPGKQGRGHANHYRLVRKGAHTSLLEGAKAKRSRKPKGAPANLLDAEKVRQQTPRGAPAHLIPLLPSEKIPLEESGAPKRDRAGTGLSGSTVRKEGGSSKDVDPPLELSKHGANGVGYALASPPLSHTQRAIARAYRLREIQEAGGVQ